MPEQNQSPLAGTPIGKTTLGAAITTVNQTVINLATLTITVGPYTTVTAANPQWGFLIDGEIMRVLSVAGGASAVSVSRGQEGTAAKLHGNGQTVYAAPLQNLPSVAPAQTYVLPPKFRFQSVPIGSVAYGSFGNATTDVNGTQYLIDVYVPLGFVATGIAVLNAGTVGTDKGLVALYDIAGNLIASSAVAGALTSGANAFQTRAFSPGPIWVPAGQYLLCYQTNGTTDNFRSVAASTFVDCITGSATGTFGTLPAVTVPTTFTANVGPIAYLY